MKIERRDGQLILRHPPLRVLLFLGSSVFAIAIFASISTATLTRFACTSRVCNLKTEYLVLLPPREWTVDRESLKRAEVERQSRTRSNGSTDITYRVVLDVDVGPFPNALTVPLTATYTSNRSLVEDQIRTINAYLANPEGELEIIQNNYWQGVILFSVFGVPGLMLIAIGTTSTTWIVDRMRGTLHKVRQGIWGQRRQTYPLAKISGVSLTQTVVHSKRSSSRLVSQVFLELPENRLFVDSGSLAEMRLLAEHIQTYMGFNEIQSNSDKG